MGWRMDWLYRLIFQQVRFVWEQMHKEGADGRYGVPPDYLLVQQCREADGNKAHCLSPVLHPWRYEETGLAELSPLEAQPEAPVTIRGMFYTVGVVRFHIAEKRDRVTFEFVLGPRYGRGRVWQVRGQGATGKLIPDTDAVGWIS